MKYKWLVCSTGRWRTKENEKSRNKDNSGSDVVCSSVTKGSSCMTLLLPEYINTGTIFFPTASKTSMELDDGSSELFYCYRPTTESNKEKDYNT